MHSVARWNHTTMNYTRLLYYCVYTTWWLSVDPVPRVITTERSSMRSDPDVSVVCDITRVISDELLKHAVNVLISDVRQRGVPCGTELCRLVPSHHWSTDVETVLIIIVTGRHMVTLGYLGDWCTAQHRRTQPACIQYWHMQCESTEWISNDPRLSWL